MPDVPANPSSASGADHRLADIAGLPPEWLAALKVRWINTAEEVLSIAASPDGRAGLEASLPPQASMESVLQTLNAAVGPARAAQLAAPQPGHHALGATLTEEQKKQFDVKET